MSSRLPFSDAWLSNFRKCVKDKNNVRKDIGIADMGANEKLTTQQIASLFTHLKKEGYSFGASGSRNITSYTGLEAASKVLCRWPRPSELGRMAKAQNVKNINFFKVVARVLFVKASSQSAFGKSNALAVRESRSKLVGPMGSRFASICRKHDLMYLWLHDNELVIYAKDKDDCMRALADIEGIGEGLGMVISYKSTAARKLSDKSPNWIPDLK
jgi:hypothetical protein